VGVRIPAAAPALLQERLRAGAAGSDTTAGSGSHWVVMGRDVTESRNDILKGTLRLGPKAVLLLLASAASVSACLVSLSQHHRWVVGWRAG
jgi:hypothetical protein